MSAARRLLHCLLPLSLLWPAHLLPADTTATAASCVVGVDYFVRHVQAMQETHTAGRHRHSRVGGLSLTLCEMSFHVVNGSREARCADTAADGSCQDCVQLEVGGRAVACLRRPRRDATHKAPKLAQ